MEGSRFIYLRRKMLLSGREGRVVTETSHSWALRHLVRLQAVCRQSESNHIQGTLKGIRLSRWSSYRPHRSPDAR